MKQTMRGQYLVFMALLVFAVTPSVAKALSGTVLLVSTSRGDNAQLVYKASKDSIKVTPIFINVDTVHPQQVSVLVVIDGQKQTYRARTTHTKRGVSTRILMKKPKNAKYYPQGRTIEINVFALDHGPNDLLHFGVFIKK